MSYTNILKFDWYTKPIPYPGNGESNHGFSNLKEVPDAIGSIPELSEDEPMRNLVATLNARGSGLFTAGCESALSHGDKGYQAVGYVEFGINSRARIIDAHFYFDLFWMFDQHLSSEGVSGVYYRWEIVGARIESLPVPGLTCAVIIQAERRQTAEAALSAWPDAVKPLGVLAAASEGEFEDPLYLPMGMSPG